MGSRPRDSKSPEAKRRRERSPERHKHRQDKQRGHREERRERPSKHRSRSRDRQRPHKVKEEPRSHNNVNIKVEEVENAVEEKQGPNFETSGKLLEDTNVYNGIVIKYNEPPEARKTKKRWRLYVFKGEESLPVLHMHRQSAYLMGKDRKVVDVPIDHPSCSRQHAVFQYRMVKKDRGGSKVLPYIIDLNSSNGTYLNNQRIEPQRYYELREKDVLKFGYSSREYVLLHDQSKDNEDSD